MKRILLIFSQLIFLAQLVYSQTYVGMNLSRYYNWGQPVTWTDANKRFPELSYLDSAAKSNLHFNSVQYSSIVWVGGQIRIQPTDTTVWLSNWSRNFYLNLGGIRSETMEANHFVYNDINLPYRTIFKGDTTDYLLDSIAGYNHQMTNYGGFGQIGFGLSQKIVGERRLEGEFGMRIMAGYGILNSDYGQTLRTELMDTTLGSGSLNVTSNHFNRTVPKSSLWMFSFDFIGGVYIPIEPNKNTWWLGLHGIIGMTAMHQWGTWKYRLNASPQIGLHYRIPTKEEREKMSITE